MDPASALQPMCMHEPPLHGWRGVPIQSTLLLLHDGAQLSRRWLQEYGENVPPPNRKSGAQQLPLL